MMHAPIFKKAALALAAAGLMASVPAHADTLADEVGQIPEVVGAQSAIDTLRWLEDDPA